jgi:hypothetical protein
MNKIAIYTILVGDYGVLSTPVKYSTNIDYICFTDNSNLKSDVWQFREYPILSIEDNRVKSRYLKLCPHKALQDYDASMYIDANMVIQEIPDILDILGDSNIVIKKHNDRDSIYRESLACMRLDKANITNQMEIYKKQGIDIEHTGLYDCGMIFRKHNDPAIRNLGEEWWGHLYRYSCRDQLSFPVVFANYPIKDFPRSEFDLLVKRKKHKKSPVPVYGFMHICTLNNWRQVVEEQLQLIKRSGLYDRLLILYCGIVGMQDTSFLDQYAKVKILYKDPKLTHFEFLTLEYLQKFCQTEAPTNSKIFYIHTKGISKKGKPDPISEKMSGYLTDWRNYLNYYILEKYEECVRQLNYVDIVGVNWRGLGSECPIYKGVTNHFSGNFWWAKTEYIKRLGHIDEGKHGRCECEFWIGKSAGKVASLFQTDVDHYRNRYPANNYRGKIQLHRWKFENGKSVALMER